jgi:hypothetical protein
LNPSINSSPWIREAPHSGLSRLIRRIRSRTHDQSVAALPCGTTSAPEHTKSSTMPAQRRLCLHDPNHPKQARPKLCHQHEKYAVAVPELETRLCPTQSNIELMPKKQILGFQLPATRLEQVANKQGKHSENSNHRPVKMR